RSGCGLPCWARSPCSTSPRAAARTPPPPAPRPDAPGRRGRKAALRTRSDLTGSVGAQYKPAFAGPGLLEKDVPRGPARHAGSVQVMSRTAITRCLVVVLFAAALGPDSRAEDVAKKWR